MPTNTDTYSASIVAAVRAEMASQERRLHELREPLGLSWPTVSGRLNGHTPFTLDEIAKIADFLGVTVAYLHEAARLRDGASRVQPDPAEVARITPPHQDAWAQPSRARARRAS
jgi:hypothetical protein